MARTTLLIRAAVAALLALGGAAACGSGDTEITDQVIDGGGTEITDQVIDGGGTEITDQVIDGGGTEITDQVIDGGGTEITADDASTSETASAGDEATSETASAGGDATSDGCGAPLEPGFQQLTVTSQGQSRDVTVYVPLNYDPSVATPVVLNWHGLGSSGDEQLLYSEFAPLADRETVLLVAATGLPNPGDSLARASWELTADQDPDRDDVVFANDVLDAVEAAACVDTDRVYSTGLSNGGYFTSVLVCEMADRLAAAASVAGVIHDETCEPSRPVSYMEIHGTADTTVPMLGGETSLEVDPEQQERIAELMANVIPDEVAEFATDFRCAPPADAEVSPGVTATLYSDCDDGTEVRFYAVEGAGHVWPGSGLNAMFEADTTASDSLEATEEVWAFFAAHTRTP